MRASPPTVPQGGHFRRATAAALGAYRADGGAGKDSLLICDTWEIADALNRRLHDTLTTPGPSVHAARDQSIRVGDLIVSRHNHAGITMRPGAGHQPGERIDQVRSGNRWRVAAVDAATNRVAAERLTDKARVVFDGEYLRAHITWGYAVTVHGAQGVTADTAHAVIGDGATRAMAYVAMSSAATPTRPISTPGEADHEHTQPDTGDEVHELRRGTKYSAAHYLRTIAANDPRPRTVHVAARLTDRDLLPDIVGRLLNRDDQRRCARGEAWRHHTTAAREFRAAYERITATAERTAGRSRRRDVDGLAL